MPRHSASSTTRRQRPDRTMPRTCSTGSSSFSKATASEHRRAPRGPRGGASAEPRNVTEESGLVPRREDIHHILVIGSGPIVIGQACEFDYSGTQACRVLRDEGFRVSLINSNPATIMTDPEFADATYIEPLDVASLRRIIERERPDALLPTLGGQTALNLAIALHEAGVLEEFGVELIGASV